jgi:hypothetical protein
MTIATTSHAAKAHRFGTSITPKSANATPTPFNHSYAASILAQAKAPLITTLCPHINPVRSEKPHH